MTSLAQTLSGIVGDAFEAQGLERFFGAVKVADRPDLAQFQCNGAMSVAKAQKKNPREVAGAIVEILQKNAAFSKVEIAGPGFINLNVTDEFLVSFLADMVGGGRMGIPDTGHGAQVVLDYGGPNIAKAMHVGHLRSAVIGESVRRLMIFAGYKTLGDVHLGDWGTNMGILIDDYVMRGEEHILRNADISDPAQEDALMDDMAVRYPKASGIAKENPEIMTRAKNVTVRLQNKEEPYYSLWQIIRSVSILGMEKNYKSLNVHFDLWKGEGDVHDYIAPMVQDLRENHVAIESEGAIVVPVAQNDDKKEVPPLILYKSDGAVMYGTTDLATIVERVKLYDPVKIVYIVDQRQSLHFEQVFRAARKGEILRPDVELTHAGFGTMNGPDGKPFKTRAGDVLRLDDFIVMSKEKSRARMEEAHIGEDMDDAEKEHVADMVGVAAIKFADLHNARTADYVFDLDRLTSFEGKTGPYLLYQAVRIKSLLRKAGYKEAGISGKQIVQDVDRPLALLLTELPDSVDAALKNYMPHYLCDYAFRLAQAFSSFYGNCHILSETDEIVRNSRLALCAATVAQLELVLNLLGIDIPERM